MVVSLSAADIYAEVIGTGKPLLMIHGNYCDHRLMKGCMEPVFTSDSCRKTDASWRRIYFDLPGMGETILKKAILSTDDIFDLIVEFIEKVIPENVFYIAYDNNYKVLDLSFITEGSYTSCKLYVGNILVSTIMNNKTKFVSFVHNHPAGSLEPSSVDVDVSIKLHTALEAINKRYLEHYIVSYRGATRISDANNVLGQVKQEIIEDYYKFVAKKEESGYQFEFEDFEMGFG